MSFCSIRPASASARTKSACRKIDRVPIAGPSQLCDNAQIFSNLSEVVHAAHSNRQTARNADHSYRVRAGEADKIAARFMRQDYFEFTPQFKLIIAGNHKPGLRSVDEAIRRRFNLIPFTVTIPPSERDPDLAERLKAEWGGILSWMIEGCLEWQHIGLAPPEVVTTATAAYLEAEDALAAWLDDCCTR